MTGVDVAYLDGDGLAHEISAQADLNSTVQRCGVEKETCLRGLQVRADGDAIAAVMTAPVGQGAALQLQNIDCPFNMRDGSCKVKAHNGGSGLATLVTPSLTLEVGATLMNNHALGRKTVHHLDLAVSDYRPSGTPGGLVGQTVHYRYDAAGQPIMKGAFSLPPPALPPPSCLILRFLGPCRRFTLTYLCRSFPFCRWQAPAASMA
jgi:hypothetical protein